MKIVNSPTATNTLNIHTKNVQNKLNEIASGKKAAAEDPAMMQIAQALMSDATVMAQGIQNANDNIAMLQIADGILQNISKIALNLDTLNVRANSATLNADQKAMLQKEFSAQVKAIDDAMQSASYNGISIFGNSFSASIGTSEIGVSIPKLDTSRLKLGNTDALKEFQDAINTALNEVGSGVNAFSSATDTLLVARTNTLAAYSQMADADIAQSVDTLKNENLLTQTALFAQAHRTRIDQERVMGLLR